MTIDPIEDSSGYKSHLQVDDLVERRLADEMVRIFEKHFGKHFTKCPDCGGFQVHVCEEAFRQFLVVPMFRKGREYERQHGSQK